ncbi:hypothetical protein FXO37_28901 [Capsicum annuum]|nr:hypothetical protein FXO37_28901 [Capsicum annuum]
MHAAGMLPARKERKKSDMVQFRFDYLQYGSRFPKKSLGTIKKRYLGNENYRGLYWRDPMILRQGGSYAYFTYLTKWNEQRFIFGFMDWIESASRHNQSEALVIDKRFSKGDPLEFLSLKYSLSYQMKEFTIKLLTLLKYQRATHPMVWAVISSAWLGSSCWSSHAQRLKFILSFLLGVLEETYLLEGNASRLFVLFYSGNAPRELYSKMVHDQDSKHQFKNNKITSKEVNSQSTASKAVDSKFSVEVESIFGVAFESLGVVTRSKADFLGQQTHQVSFAPTLIFRSSTLKGMESSASTSKGGSSVAESLKKTLALLEHSGSKYSGAKINCRSINVSSPLTS